MASLRARDSWESALLLMGAVSLSHLPVHVCLLLDAKQLASVASFLVRSVCAPERARSHNFTRNFASMTRIGDDWLPFKEDAAPEIQASLCGPVVRAQST
mmetsp:Transcript_16235/g.30546  ORF Transcript_16235/g.30546 Transcript_16235/m.30546 type:complete len:100 (+) Transcript_16235:177-476(+)